MSPLPSFVVRLLHRLRYRLYGRTIGLGRPISVAALDHEYASGAWAHFFGPSELARHQALIALIQAAQPRPRLLDLGCGSGRLASLLTADQLASYLGIDVSSEGIQQARALSLPSPLDNFACHDFENWTPSPGSFDVIVFNESLGYATDPLTTAQRFAATLPPQGTLLVSLFRSANHAEFWIRLSRGFTFASSQVVTNETGQTWDVRRLSPL